MENKDLDKLLKQSAESAKQFGESISQVIKEFIEFAEKKIEDTNKEDESKHKVLHSTNGFKIDLGVGNRTISFRKSELLESISVDAGITDTKICLNRTIFGRTVVSILDLDGYSMSDVAMLLIDLIKLYQPKNLYLDKHGAGKGIEDYLLPMLENEKYKLTEQGELVYKSEENNKKDRFDIFGCLIDKINCDIARYGYEDYLFLINPDVAENIPMLPNYKTLKESQGLHGVYMGYDCIVTDSVKEAEVYRKVN